MIAEMILAGTRLVGMVLSFAVLFRARKLSVDLWPTAPCSHPLLTGSDGEY